MDTVREPRRRTRLYELVAAELERDPSRSNREIAGLVGCSKGTVLEVRRQGGVPTPGTSFHLTTGRRAEVRAAIAAELERDPFASASAIARRVDCSPHTVLKVRSDGERRAVLAGQAPATEKECGRCRQTLPLDDFYPDGRYVDGGRRRLSYCKTCQSSWARDYRLRTQYGIGAEDFDRLLASQLGACGICGTAIDQAPGAAHIDHDHTAGRGAGVRGLLCGLCNRGVGMFRDNPAHLRAAIEYLLNPPAAALSPLEAT